MLRFFERTRLKVEVSAPSRDQGPISKAKARPPRLLNGEGRGHCHRGQRSAPRSHSTPRPGLPWFLFLPGGFPNKVREGKVPVIVQPRFHRVLVSRPRGAGARPLHDRAARLCPSRVPGSTPAGVPPSSNGLGLETLPLASLRSAPLRRAARAPGQPAAPPPSPKAALQVPRAGPLRQPVPPRGPAQTGSYSLSSPGSRGGRGGDWRALRKLGGHGLKAAVRPLGCAARRAGSRGARR